MTPAERRADVRWWRATARLFDTRTRVARATSGVSASGGLCAYVSESDTRDNRERRKAQLNWVQPDPEQCGWCLWWAAIFRDGAPSVTRPDDADDRILACLMIAARLEAEVDE